MSVGPVLRNGQLRARGTQSPALNGRSGRRSEGRPEVRGKFLFVGEEKLHVRGVSYGTFARDDRRNGYPPPDVVVADFARMGANDMNAVRTYTVPPRICVCWLLNQRPPHHARGLRALATGMSIAR